MQDKNLLPLDDDIEQFHKSQEKKRKRNKRQKRHNNRLYHRLYRDFFVQVANELDIKLPAYQKISIKTSNEANDKIQYLIRTANSNTGSISEEASAKINDLQTKLDKSTKMVNGLKDDNSKLSSDFNNAYTLNTKLIKRNKSLNNQLQNYQNQSTNDTQSDEDTANNVNSASDTSNSVDNSDNADISNSASASSDSNSENNFNTTGNINGSWVTRDETDNQNNQ